jgi:ribonuclease HI
MIIEHLSEFDGCTLRAEAQEALGIEYPPHFRDDELVIDSKGRIQGFVDGSLKPNEMGTPGASAVYLGPNTDKYSAEREWRILSSYEAELRGAWRLLWALPRDRDISVCTDSQSTIDRIERRQADRDLREECERYESYVQRILDLISVKKAHSATVSWNFVFSHLIDEGQSDLSEKEEIRRWTKMHEKYGDKVGEMLEGNRQADRLAAAAGPQDKWCASLLKETDPEFEMFVNDKQVTSGHRKKCYEQLINEVVQKNQHDPSHREAFDWAQPIGADTERSSLLLKSNKRKEHSLVRMMFMLRNNRIRTRKREQEIAEKEKNQQNPNYYVLRRRRYFSESTCPMECQEVEDIQHLCSCKHAEKFREEARIRIKWELTTRGVSAEQADITEWAKQPEWKEKYTWLGMIPKTFTEDLKEYMDEKEINDIIIEIQKHIIEAMKNTWTQRCKKLFEVHKRTASSAADTEEPPQKRRQTKPPRAEKRAREPETEPQGGRKKSTTKATKDRAAAEFRPPRPTRPRPEDGYQPPHQTGDDTADTPTEDAAPGLDGDYWKARTRGRSESGRAIRQSLSRHQSQPQEPQSTYRGVPRPPAAPPYTNVEIYQTDPGGT